MSTEAASVVTDEIRAWIGRTSDPLPLLEEISAADVRRYIDATGDANPLWTDDGFARAQGYRGRIVPPAMVLELGRRLDWAQTGVAKNPKGESLLENIPLPDEYTDTRNAGSETEWLQPVYLGDRLTVQHRIVDIVARQGRARVGIYITRQSEFRNAGGDIVARHLQTVVKLKPTAYQGAGSREEQQDGSDR